MTIENDIQRLFEMVLQKYGGNKAAAAASLNTNAVTFWHWVSGTRKLPSTLCKAIDNAGGRLLLPGENAPLSTEQDREVERLREKIEHLTKENALLTKLLSKYEAEEQEKKGAPGTGGVPPTGSVRTSDAGSGARLSHDAD